MGGTMRVVIVVIALVASAVGELCQSDPLWEYHDGFCYYSSANKALYPNGWTWQSAEEWCVQQDGHLISIHSQSEERFISTLIEQSSLDGTRIWIGLNTADYGGTVSWSDGTALDYTSPFIDSLECTDVRSYAGSPHRGYLLWQQTTCDSLQEFVCKRPDTSLMSIESLLGVAGVKERAGSLGACASGWLQFVDQCYQIHGYQERDIETWEVAKVKCVDFGGQMVTILSPGAQAFLTAEMEFEQADVWIGLTNVGSGSQFHWTDNSEVTYLNWGRQQPDGYPGSTGTNPPSCVVMMAIKTEAGKWNDQGCDRQLPYLCQRPIDPDLTPPPDMISLCRPDYVSYFQSCFKYVTDATTFEKAEAACVVDGTHLASVADAYEEAFVEVLMYEHEETSTWVGLRHLSGGEYTWTDDWPVYYTFWGPGEPSGGVGEGCVEATTDGHWDDTSCAKQQSFVCKYTGMMKPTPGPTAAGFCSGAWIEYGEYCYLFQTHSTVGITYSEADTACAAEGAIQLTVHSEDENAFILRQMSLRSGLDGDAWLKVRKGADGGYYYDDATGEPVNYANWGTGEPYDNGDMCVVMKTDVYGHWAVSDCTTQNKYGCKKAKSPGTESPIAPTTCPPIVQPTCPPVDTVTCPQTAPLTCPPTDLSGGAIAGIVIAVLCFAGLLVALAGLIYIVMRSSKPPHTKFENEIEISGQNVTNISNS